MIKMLTKHQRQRIISFAKKRAAQNDPFHRLPHLEEVARNAGFLAREEGADPEICWAAAMLHDICKSGRADHGTAGAKEASEFLAGIGLPEGLVDAVSDAIYFHNKPFRGGPIERRVLWDSDKLTIIGPSGFSRRLLPYWIMKQGEEEGTKTAAREYLFFEPLFRTKTGRKIAKRHSALMHRFLASLNGGVLPDA